MASPGRPTLTDNPAQVLVVSFVALIGIGTLLLWLPVSTDGAHPGGLDALFLSTSSVTVTGLTSFDIGRLSLFGELVVLALIQVGGFGIMTISTVIGVVTARRIGVRRRLLARAEIGSIEIGEVRSLVLSILRITLLIELCTAVILSIRLITAHGASIEQGVFDGLFLSVSAFNNAGLFPDSRGLVPFADDALLLTVTSVAIILGGLGFPVIVELWRRVRPLRWSLHTKLVMLATAVLLVVGPLVVLAFEWTNALTLGPMSVPEKVLTAWFQGVSPRTAGFATIDVGAYNDPTVLVVVALMFVGAGPASTGGGIRVTTFALLGFVLWSVVRGDSETSAFRRRIPHSVVRQAITVVLISIGAVVSSTLLLLARTPFTLTQTLFETTSAFGTVGLTMGITEQLPPLGHVVLMALMLMGRVGPITLVAALATRERPRLYRYPEEQPIVG